MNPVRLAVASNDSRGGATSNNESASFQDFIFSERGISFFIKGSAVDVTPPVVICISLRTHAQMQRYHSIHSFSFSRILRSFPDDAVVPPAFL